MVKRIIGYSILIITIFILITLFSTTETVEFTDPNLKKVILEKLGKSNDEIYSYELKNITELDASNQNIKSLNGIENLYNLEKIDLSDNFIENVEPLGNLRKLRTIILHNNEILDLNDIGLQNLMDLKQLKEIDLSHNVVREYIDNIENEIRLFNIDILCQFKWLERIHLSDNFIKEIGCLANLQNLKEIDISENLINLDGLAILPQFKLLEKLNISKTGLESLKYILAIKNLKNLNINDNYNVSDLELLENLTNLEVLKIRKTGFDPEKIDLTNLKKLVVLDISNNDINNITFLNSFPKLKKIDVSYNRITDISLFKMITYLEYLNLKSNLLTDYNDLNEITGLKELYLSGNLSDDFNIKAIIYDNLEIKDFSIIKYTGIPAVYINTNNTPILSKEERVFGTMKIVNNNNSNYPQEGLYEGYIGIKGRGNSSWNLPKKPYNIELWNKYQNSIDHQMLDMKPESDWVLIANHSDKSLLRNYISNKISNMLGMEYTPDTRFVEVYINDEYQGLYQLTEKIKRDNNRLQLNKLENIDKDQKYPGITGGYILRADRIENNDFFTTKYATKSLIYEYPKMQDITIEQKGYIENYINEFEKIIYDDELLKTNDFSKYIDIDSFINYFLIVEFSKDKDALGLSEYMYKDEGSKLKMGPIWDFDIAYGNAFHRDLREYYGWSNLTTSKKSWYNRLFRNDYFFSLVNERWAEVRINFEQLINIIDKKSELMRPEIDKNFVKWPIIGTYVWPNPEPIAKSYEEEISNLKQWITNRINWIDSELKNIRKYL